MAQLKLGAIKDLGGIGGFTLSSGGVTANGTLTVNDLVIDGTVGGSSSFVLPNPSGQSNRFVTNNGSSMSFGDVNLSTGIRSMQVWTSNGTWSRPSGVKTIMVTVTGAGGGGSGFTDAAFAVDGNHQGLFLNVEAWVLLDLHAAFTVSRSRKSCGHSATFTRGDRFIQHQQMWLGCVSPRNERSDCQ